jgi:hypothetical protein
MTDTSQVSEPSLSRRRFVRKLGFAGLGATFATGVAELVGNSTAQAKQGHRSMHLTAPIKARAASCPGGYASATCYKCTGCCPGGPCHPSGHCCYACYQASCFVGYFCASSCAGTIYTCVPGYCD